MKLSGVDIWKCLSELRGSAMPVRSLDREASVLRRQRVRADAFTAMAAPDGSTAQATMMFESTDRTTARVVALLGRQIGVLAVEEWRDDDSRR